MIRALPALVLGCLALAAGSSHAEQRIANISQGTNMALALTPDGQSLVVDLLGRLWLLPASGGGARQLTPDDEGARHPRVSPDGRSVVYQRRLEGQWDLWLLELDSGDRRPLTQSRHNEREPDFSTDGASVVFASDETGHFCLWSVDVASGVLTQLTEEPGDASFPSMSDRGEIAYIKENEGRSSLRVLLTHGAAADLLSTDNELSAPTWRPGGDVLIFNEVSADGFRGQRSSVLKMLVLSSKPVIKTLTRSEDVFTARVAWTSPGEYFYTADGQIWRRGIAQVTRQPVHLFAAVTVDSASPEPSIEPLDAPGPHAVLGVTGRSVSEDGRTRVFTALGDLWLVEGRGAPSRLTDDPFIDTDASVSPEGDFAVFASDRSGYMDLWRVTLPDGVLSQLTNRPGKAYRPAVSPDGSKVAFLETKGVGDRGAATLRVLDLSSASSDRTLEEGLLAPGAPAWVGDEVSLRFHATTASPVRDRLLTVDLNGGNRSIAPALSTEALSKKPEESTDDASPALEWKAAAAEQPYVVQVGRLFDGIRSDYRRHVDIHIEGQRIVAIVGRGMKPLPQTVIDARDATVIPGLIDVHAHQSSIMGERLGRVWLAHGITTVRELTDDVAEAMERAESWSSGRRLGPRLIVTPAAGGGASAIASAPAVLSPVPVRSYSTLRAASSLFSPGQPPVGPSTWVETGHRETGSPVALRTSPLNLTYEDVFSTVVQSGTVITSNLAAIGGARATNPWAALTRHSTFQRMYSAEERALWLDAAASAPVGPLQDNIARLVRAGGQVAAGTQSPATPYGLGLHMELALLAEAGIPADQVLRIASASNAMALGLERQVGTLEEGKLADFVVVNGNPLMNLSEALNVTAVVRGGVWIDQHRLTGGP